MIFNHVLLEDLVGFRYSDGIHWHPAFYVLCGGGYELRVVMLVLNLTYMTLLAGWFVL